MAETKKAPTHKELFARIVEMAQGVDEEVVAFAQKKIEQLENRKDKPRKPYFNRDANDFAARLVTVMDAAGAPMTNKELAEQMELELGIKVTPQKIASALRRIKNDEVKILDDNGKPTEETMGTALKVEGAGTAKDPKTFELV